VCVRPPPLLYHRLEKGTTYNAYIIYGEEFTALVDASHEKFSNLFIATLQEQLKAAGRKIDYVLVRTCLLCWFCAVLEGGLSRVCCGVVGSGV
jgi:hypothetical protein